MVQLSHAYMITGKTIALTRQPRDLEAVLKELKIANPKKSGLYKKQMHPNTKRAFSLQQEYNLSNNRRNCQSGGFLLGLNRWWEARGCLLGRSLAWTVSLPSKDEHNKRWRVVNETIFSSVKKMSCGEQVYRSGQSWGFCALENTGLSSLFSSF